MTTIIEAATIILRNVGRPMHASELAQAIVSSGIAKLSGATPWKTVTSLISTDIRNFSENSLFQRTGHARFALREWGAVEFLVNKRRINPVNETIRVVPSDKFQKLLYRFRSNPLFMVSVEKLVAQSIAMERAAAEETTDFVQLIPTFIIRKTNEILTYTRTKRLPEARLHNLRCVSFGGHMKVDDLPDLFARSYDDPRALIFRELYEELSFSRSIRPKYLGALYLQGSKFEQQHAGIVFEVVISKSCIVESLETTMHSDVKFEVIHDLMNQAESFDSWSRLLLGVANGRIR